MNMRRKQLKTRYLSSAWKVESNIIKSYLKIIELIVMWTYKKVNTFILSRFSETHAIELQWNQNLIFDTQIYCRETCYEIIPFFRLITASCLQTKYCVTLPLLTPELQDLKKWLRG